jgi:hypothetical protein
MRLKWSLLSVCAVFVALAVTATAQEIEPNAFLVKPANSTAELVQQASTNQVVMSRFMRHFGMTRDEVIAYLKSLKLSTIKEDGAYLVYNTPESGEIRSRVLFYRKGTPVWVDESGNYILKASCGNPMVRGTDFGKADQTETTAMRSVSSTRELIAEQPPGISTTSVTGMAVTPPIAEYDAIVIAEIEPAAPLLPEGSGQVILPLALIIPFTGGILFNDQGGEPIPEPGSMLALGTGLAAFAAYRRRKKQAA